jgi:hypothetical protein
MTRAQGILLVGLLALAGCSENAVIQSVPIGAKVFINDRLVGTTPALFTVERSHFAHAFGLRLEKQGYEPYVGELTTRVCGGRVTAAVFTLGVFYLFKSPWCLVDQPPIPLLPVTTQ